MLRKKDNNIEFLKYFDKRQSNCIKCSHLVSYIDKNKNIKFEGHYQTPEGIYCKKCYKG